MSVFVVWKSHEVKGAYSTLDLAKKAAEKKKTLPDGFQGRLEWEDEGNGSHVLWAIFKGYQDDLMYVTECVVNT